MSCFGFFDKLPPALRVWWLFLNSYLFSMFIPDFFFFHYYMASYLATWWVIFEVFKDINQHCQKKEEEKKRENGKTNQGTLKRKLVS